MDVEEYLKRIGYSQRPNRKPDLDFLMDIQKSHVLNVPWENLDVISRTPIKLTPEALFDKIVLRKRGGWFYELNGLLHWALVELGFKARLFGGRSWNSELIKWQREQNHAVIIVDVDSIDYVVDVAYTCNRTPMTPLPMFETSSVPITCENGRFRVIKVENFWRMDKQYLDDDTWQLGPRIDADVTYQLKDFQYICDIYQARADPVSIYMCENPIVYIKTHNGTGTVMLIEDKLFVHENVGYKQRKSKVEEKTQLTNEDYQRIIESTDFNIRRVNVNKLELDRFRKHEVDDFWLNKILK